MYRLLASFGAGSAITAGVLHISQLRKPWFKIKYDCWDETGVFMWDSSADGPTRLHYVFKRIVETNEEIKQDEYRAEFLTKIEEVCTNYDRPPDYEPWPNGNSPTGYDDPGIV